MMTLREKYTNDVRYHTMVEVMADLIERCEFTPSEVREMAVLACILYEERRGPRPIIIGGKYDKGQAKEKEEKQRKNQAEK
jgi:hypothetical protein